MTVIPTGLGATLGFAAEDTVGTFKAPDRWLQFEKESFALKKKTVQGQGINGGLYEKAGRRVYTNRETAGTVPFDLTDRLFGLFIEHMIGSTPVVGVPSAGGAVLQTHTPGVLVGKSLSAQVGRPDTSGTMRAFSYNGLKVTDWELACKTEAGATLDLTFDGWDEDTETAYAAPSSIAANPLTFAGGQVLLGGTVSTSGGVTTVADGVAVATVKSASVKGTNGLDVDRFFLGTSVKAEQLDNGFRKLTGALEVEFANLTDVYAAFAADTSVALQLNFVGPVIGTATDTSFLRLIVPSIYFDGGPPEVDGTKTLTQKASFTGLDDDTNPVLQFQYQSLDASV